MQLYRISHGTNKTNSNGKVALLHHGLGMDGACFIILNPKRSLGYILADTGYDVWLLNARGTELSNKHKYISKENKKDFYNFRYDSEQFFLEFSKKMSNFLAGTKLDSTIFQLPSITY